MESNSNCPWAGWYEVSSFGRVRHAHRLMAIIKRDGYLTVSLNFNGQKRTVRVHRLVAAAFKRLPKDNEIVHHKNNRRDDNRVENLECTTRVDNSQYPRHPNAKIDRSIAVEMRRNGYTYREIGERFGASISAVHNILLRAIEAGLMHADENNVTYEKRHRP